MKITSLTRRCLLLLLVLASLPLGAVEFGGGKIEYMNSKETSFLGFGLFTSNKRFDAEVEGFIAPQVFTGKTSDTTYLGSNYRLFFVAFSAYFHFIRTDKMSVFIGGGIMPWLPRTYAYHFAAGMDFFFSDNWRIFYTFRFMENNAAEYRYPTGTSIAVGFKYAFRLLNI